MRDRKIIDYDHVYAKCLDQIPELVKMLIEKGWQPFGQVVRGEDLWWNQPIVKYHHDKGEI